MLLNSPDLYGVQGLGKTFHFWGNHESWNQMEGSEEERVWNARVP